MSASFSLHAFSEVRELLEKAGTSRLLLGDEASVLASLHGGPEDIAYRNQLRGRWLARIASEWIKAKSELRHTRSTLPQSLIVIRSEVSHRALLGACAMTTDGLGITPADQLALVQATESDMRPASLRTGFTKLGTGYPRTRLQKSDCLPFLMKRPDSARLHWSTSRCCISFSKIWATNSTRRGSSSQPRAFATRSSGRSCSAFSAMA